MPAEGRCVKNSLICLQSNCRTHDRCDRVAEQSVTDAGCERTEGERATREDAHTHIGKYGDYAPVSPVPGLCGSSSCAVKAVEIQKMQAWRGMRADAVQAEPRRQPGSPTVEHRCIAFSHPSHCLFFRAVPSPVLCLSRCAVLFQRPNRPAGKTPRSLRPFPSLLPCQPRRRAEDRDTRTHTKEERGRSARPRRARSRSIAGSFGPACFSLLTLRWRAFLKRERGIV
jgi:hypothetical protein